MTNKELISKIREEILHLKMKELQRTNGINTGADVYLSSYAVLSILSNALTEDSEDERIRKWLVDFFGSIKETVWIHRDITCGQILAWLEKQKEPEKEELAYRLNGLMQEYINEAKDQEEEEHRFKCYKLFWNALEDASYFEQKEQKPAEKQDYSGLNDLERAIHRGFLSAGVENVPIAIIKETAKECLAQIVSKNSVKFEEGFKYGRESGLRDGQKYVLNNLDSYGLCKPAWSEEDERMLERAIHIIVEYSDIDEKESEIVQNWLKSLRPRWKPTEQQMEAIEFVIKDYREDGCIATANYLQEILDQIKKL